MNNTNFFQLQPNLEYRRSKMSVSNLWSQEEELFLMQLYTKYGNSLTRVSDVLKNRFPNCRKGIFTVNRISSKIQTLMREGLQIYERHLMNNEQIVRGFRNHPLSALVNKVRSARNDYYFETKLFLMSLKRKTGLNEDKLKQITAMMYDILQVPKAKRISCPNSEEFAKRKIKRSIKDKLREWFIYYDNGQEKNLEDTSGRSDKI